MSKENSNGKGDSPKSCFSKDFKNNYDEIDWGKKDFIGGRTISRKEALKDLGNPADWNEEIDKILVEFRRKPIELGQDSIKITLKNENL